MMTPEQRNKLVVGLAILLLFLIATAPRDANGGHQKPAGYTDGEGKDKPAHKHTKYFDLVDDSHLNASLKEFLRTHSVGSNQSTYVPRNITKVPYYTGYWTAAPPNSGLRGANWNRSVIGLKRPPSLYRHNTEGVFYLGQLKSVTHAKGPDVIYEGSLAIRDGVYSTDRSKEFSLRGTYAWERGLLLAVGCDLDANPYELPLVHFNASRNRSSGSATKAVGSSNNNNELVRTFFEGKDVVFDALRGQVVNKVCPLKVALAFHTTRNISQLSLGDIKKEVADYNNNKLISMEGFVFSNYHKQMLTLSGYIYSTHERRVEALCYLLYEAFAVSMDFMFSFRQSKAISSLALASRVSVKTIGFQSVIDIFLSVGHFVLAISFYAILFVAFVLLYFLDNAVYYLILIAYSFWVPQIIRNVVNNTADTLSPLYIIGVSLTKIYTPLYFFLNKNNFLMVKTNKTFGISLALHVGFQVLVLFAQRVLPRLCMPKSIIPEKYDYYREIPQSVLDNAANGRLECVICMEHVHVPREGKEEGGGEQAASNGENTKKSTATANAAASLEEGSGSHYMITPCDHVYHKKCLTQWLSCKLECPFCRAPLPSP